MHETGKHDNWYNGSFALANTINFSDDALGGETTSSEGLSETTSTVVDATNSYTYDGDSNLVQEIDADGRVDAYSYNDLDQQTRELWYANTTTAGEGSSYATNTMATSYDLSGDVLTAVDTYPTADDAQNSSYTFAYNTLGQQITADNNGSDPGGTTGTAGVPDVVLNATYDAIGDRLSLAATIDGTADFQNTYSYDGLGEQSGVVQQGVCGGDALAFKEALYDYDSDGRLADMSGYGGAADNPEMAIVESYTYDDDGNMNGLNAMAWYADSGGCEWGDFNLESLGMTYNADQQLTGLANYVYSSESQTNTYDHDGQLTDATGDGGGSFGFDANGNIHGTGDTIGDGNTQLSGNGYSYTYDAAGNMLTQTDASGNVTTYTWDNRNRLTSATTVNSSDETVQVVNYTYDALNQLIGESVTPYTDGVAGTTTTQRFVYDPLTGEMQLAFDGSGNLTDRFLWGPVVDQILADEKTVSGVGSAGNVEWMATNQQGSLTDVFFGGPGYGEWEGCCGDRVLVYDGLLDHIAYDAWGAVASQTAPAYAPLFGYDGVYTDPATGLQYHSQPFTGLPGRWYDPEAEVWMSKDPIFPFSGPNPYEYCGDNPTSFVDPSGHIIPLIAAGVVAAVYFFTPNTANAPGPGDATISGDPNAGLLPAALAGAGVASGGIVGGAVGGAAVADAAALGGSDAAASFLGAVVGGKVGSAVGSTIGGLSGSAPARTIGGIGGGLLGGIGGANSECPAAGGGIGATGQIGENALKSLGGESQVYFRTSMGGRYVDQLAGGIANESKVGYQSLTQDIQLQIAKDAELMQTSAVKGATWHFFTSPATGLGGPSQPLLNALQQAGIKVVTH